MTRVLPYYYYRSPGQRQISIRGGAQSQSALLAGDEANVLVIDFTDDAFAGSGHYGSAYVRSSSVVTYNSHPYDLLSYTSPSNKLTRKSDGVFRFGAHNIYLNSAAPANQSITVVSGATYSVTITGTVSVTASGAATGTWTAGTNTFTAATATLTLGSTSGAGTVHVCRTPSDSRYLDTTSVPRYAIPFEWDASGTLVGVVREPSTTNLLYPSVPQASTGVWSTLANITRTTGQTDPFGGTNAVLLTAAATTNTHIATTAIVVAATVATAYSIVKKSGGATDLNRYTLRNSTTATDLLSFTVNYDTLAIGYATGSSGASVTSLGNGWLLIAATVTSGITSGNSLIYYAGASGGVETAGENIIMAHCQLTANAYVSSPIITHAAAAVRAEDQISIDAALLPPIGAGYALYFEGEILSPSADFPSLVQLSSSDLTDWASIFYNALTVVKLLARDASVTQADLASTLTATVDTTFRAAASFATDDFRISANGGAVQTDASGTLPTDLITALIIGRLGHMRIKKVRVHYRELTDLELVSLSGTGALS